MLRVPRGRQSHLYPDLVRTAPICGYLSTVDARIYDRSDTGFGIAERLLIAQWEAGVLRVAELSARRCQPRRIVARSKLSITLRTYFAMHGPNGLKPMNAPSSGFGPTVPPPLKRWVQPNTGIPGKKEGH